MRFAENCSQEFKSSCYKILIYENLAYVDISGSFKKFVLLFTKFSNILIENGQIDFIYKTKRVLSNKIWSHMYKASSIIIYAT